MEDGMGAMGCTDPDPKTYAPAGTLGAGNCSLGHGVEGQELLCITWHGIDQAIKAYGIQSPGRESIKILCTRIPKVQQVGVTVSVVLLKLTVWALGYLNADISRRHTMFFAARQTLSHSGIEQG